MEHLRAERASVVVEPPAVGDYSLGNGIVVERKPVLDLQLALERGRLWRRIGAPRRGGGVPFLLVEGRSLDHAT